MAGGVTVMITPDGFIGFSQAGMLSPDGKCKAFAAEANGFVRGEGAGMVLLKPLSQAIADGDPIHGVIIGSSLNQDGHTNGISLPSPEAQARLVRDACVDAGIKPSQVGFVEAHGTGTAVGDPIEATALVGGALRRPPADAPLPIGSVKIQSRPLGNRRGHRRPHQGAAGAQARTDPGEPAFRELRARTSILPRLKLRVPTTLEPFPADRRRPRIVGVNSFGFGGANAHVILTEAAGRVPLRASARSRSDRGWPLVLSARSEDALRAAASQLGSVDRGPCEGQRKLAAAAGADLHARRATQSSLAPAHHRRAFVRRTGAGTSGLLVGATGQQDPDLLHAAARNTRRGSASS